MFANQSKLIVVDYDKASMKILDGSPMMSQKQYVENIVDKFLEADLPNIKYLIAFDYQKPGQSSMFFYNFQRPDSELMKISDIENIPNSQLMRIVENERTLFKIGESKFKETQLFNTFPQLQTLSFSNRLDVKRFIEFLRKDLLINFDADVKLHDSVSYFTEVKTSVGNILYTEQDLKFLDAKINECLEIIGDDIYEL